jgi:hypothetical protein
MWVVRHVVDADPTAPARAREFVAAALRNSAASERLDDAVLLTSEVVTHAVTTGAPPMSLYLYGDDKGFDVEMRDAGAHGPSFDGADAASEDERRRLALVAKIADDWGITRDPTGNTVWFTLHAQPA